MSESKTRLAVVFGGRSGEHEVSCASAASILTHLDRERYEVLPVKIGRDGVWMTGTDNPEIGHMDVSAVLAWVETGFTARENTTPLGSMLTTVERLKSVDLVFPALHGRYGEDGSLQAMLDGLDIPFIGSGPTASAMGMDKEYTKKLATTAGLTVVDDVVLRGGEDDVSPADRERLGLPVFVKPARDGSSIGVSRVDNWDEFPEALRLARNSDRKVLVEAASTGREIDISVLERPGGALEVSPPMEIFATSESTFFDYQAKYADQRTVLQVPADVDADTTARMADEAARIFRLLDCRGLLRVDFFVDEAGRTVFNEVNTFPGFTSASQYPRMWAAGGLSYGELLDVLVETGLWHAGKEPAGQLDQFCPAGSTGKNTGSQ